MKVLIMCESQCEEPSEKTFIRECKKFPNGLYQDIETNEVYGSRVIKELSDETTNETTERKEK